MKPRACLLVAASVFLPLGARAEVATVLLLEGDVLSDGQTVTAINNTAAPHAGGYAATLSTTGGLGTLSTLWGSLGAAPGDVLRSESTVGQWEQTSFESFWGAEYSILPFSGAEWLLAYSPLVNDTASGFTGLDAVFMNDTPIMVAREPVPDMPGWYWSFGSRPGVTHLGDTHLVGGITDTPGGGTQNRVLFFDPGSLPFEGQIWLAGGQNVPGLPLPLTTGSEAISFDYRLSKNGTHYVVEVGMQTGSALNDNAMVIDGVAALSDDQIMREGSPVPAASGGLPGENWDSFDFAGITETGCWLITGDTDADIAADEFIALAGEIVLREGDAVEEHTVSGAMEGAYLNEDGDVAWVWDVDGGTREALGIRIALAMRGGGYDGRDHVLMVEGDPVDLDGDGSAEGYATLVDFTGISSLTMSDRDSAGFVNVHVTADIDIQPVRVAGGGEPELPGGVSLEALGLDEAMDPSTARRAVVEALLVVRVDTRDVVGVAGSPEPAGPIRLAVAPNPIAAGGTTLRLDLPSRAHARLRVFDVMGRLVATLVDEPLAPGPHALAWDGRDAAGRRVAAGVYFARLEAGDRVESRRLLVLP